MQFYASALAEAPNFTLCMFYACFMQIYKIYATLKFTYSLCTGTWHFADLDACLSQMPVQAARRAGGPT
jgi:hypothetical protein